MSWLKREHHGETSMREFFLTVPGMKFQLFICLRTKNLFLFWSHAKSTTEHQKAHCPLGMGYTIWCSRVLWKDEDTTAGLLLLLERHITACRKVRSLFRVVLQNWKCSVQREGGKLLQQCWTFHVSSCCSTALKCWPRRLSSSSSSWKRTMCGWLIVGLVWCFIWCCSTLYKRNNNLFDTDCILLFCWFRKPKWASIKCSNTVVTLQAYVVV